jgi:hypothetical protein
VICKAQLVALRQAAPKTNTLVPIPLEVVTQKWKDQYPEDSKCVGVFP